MSEKMPIYEEVEAQKSVELDKEKIRDSFFDVLLVENVLKGYESDMAKLGFNQQQILDFMAEINNLDIEERKQILSFPYELRQTYFKNQLGEINSGHTSVQQFATELLEFSRENGYSIGFHMAPSQINKGVNRDNRETWNVKGTQRDHRDSDLPMAYYSKQYRHLYGHKPYNFVYIIRSAPDHRTDGNWFRAPSLSVVSELPISGQELHQKMEDQIKLVQEQERAHRVSDAPNDPDAGR